MTASVALPELALSLKQPWAFLMLELPPEFLKGIENRHWDTSFRGPCWVHASAGMTKREFYEACEFALGAGVPRDLLPGFDQVKRGGIVGRWEIVDVMLPGGRRKPTLAERRARKDPRQVFDHPRKGDRWHMPEQHGIIVRNARPVPFVACKGALGFWRVPLDVLEQLRKAA